MSERTEQDNPLRELTNLLAKRLADPLQSSVFTEARLLQDQRDGYDEWVNDLLDEVSCFNSIVEKALPRVDNEDDDERADAWSELHPAAMAGYLIEYLITYLQHQNT